LVTLHDFQAIATGGQSPYTGRKSSHQTRTCTDLEKEVTEASSMAGQLSWARFTGLGEKRDYWFIHYLPTTI